MPHRSFDVVTIMIVTAVALALALLGLKSGVVLILLGAPLVFFLPGYALTALAWSTLSAPKRTALSVVLSLGLTELGQVLLPLTPWGVQIGSWAVWLGSITLAAALGAFIRDHVQLQPRVRRSAAVRSLMVCSAACAVFTALGGARVVTTQPVSAALLQRWIMPTEPATPALVTPRAALAITNPVAAPATATTTSSPLPAIGAPATPVPIATLVPTATPAPAQASTRPASDTPRAERLNIALTDWPTRETNTAGMRSEADRYQLTLNGQPSVSVASVIPADNYRLSIDVTLVAGEAGVIFLAAEPATFYRIMFNTEGAYTIQQVQQNSTTAATTVVDWTTSPALLGKEHRVRIERQDNMVEFFANDQSLTTFVLPPGPSTNQAGVALAATSAQGRATFTTLVVERLARR